MYCCSFPEQMFLIGGSILPNFGHLIRTIPGCLCVSFLVFSFIFIENELMHVRFE